MPVRIIFTDIDGTLINSDLKVTLNTRKAILGQVVKGNAFVPVSARMPQAIKTAAGQIAKICPMVAYNGALVLNEAGKTISSTRINTNEVVNLCHDVDKKDAFVWNVYSNNNWYCKDRKSKYIVNEEKIVEVDAIETNLEKISKLAGVHKVLIIGDCQELDRLSLELASIYRDLSFVKSSPHLLEVMKKNVSKSWGVKKIAAYYQVKLKDCIAFGDNYNDAEMLEEVGHPFLMGNAPADMKNRFTTTLDNDHDGIVAVLNQDWENRY